MSGSSKPRNAIVLAPMAGRIYDMGRISAIFKADEEETQARYSVSEWWLEPRTKGPWCALTPRRRFVLRNRRRDESTRG